MTDIVWSLRAAASHPDAGPGTCRLLIAEALEAAKEIDRLRDENERLSEAMAYWKVYDFTESKYLLCAQIERLRNEVREWREMDDQIRNFVGGKGDGRNTLEIVKEKFNVKWDAEDHSYRLLLDSYTHPIIELLQAENERLRSALGKVAIGNGDPQFIACAALEEK
jgi:hypothetical protein